MYMCTNEGGEGTHETGKGTDIQIHRHIDT